MVNSCQSAIWRGDLAFLRSGRAEYLDKWRAIGETIRWEFVSGRSSQFLSVSQCNMSICDQTVAGYGMGYLLNCSLRTAFAEAWERFWARRLAKEDLAGLGCTNSSNGFAAGRSNFQAEQAARGELAERALFLTAWQTQRGWIPYLPQSASARFCTYRLKQTGWNLRFFLLCGGEVGQALTALAIHKDLGAVFDSAYVSECGGILQSEHKLAGGVLHGALCAGVGRSTFSALPLKGLPADHATFYSNPHHLDAFSFLNSTDSQRPLPALPNPQGIKCRIVNPAGLFPAVAVAINPDWPILRWGRASVTGDNPWPHPLA